jgi:hypothetical protein
LEFYVDGPILHASDPDAAKVAAGLVRAIPGDGYRGTREEWEADLISRSLWDGKNPATADEVWISEDDHREVRVMAAVRWNDRNARYPALPVRKRP